MNRATRCIATTLAIVFAISGMNHGFFEALQGNTPTGGLLIDAISEAHRTWTYGGETAFTVIPNFMLTGIAAIGAGLAIIVWSAYHLHRRRGPMVLLLLYLLLFLVGGGIGQIPFFLAASAVATRINSPLAWWRRVLPEGVRRVLAGVWPWTLGASVLMIVMAMAIAILGHPPGMTDSERVINLVFSLLIGGLVVHLFTAVAGFADDIERQTSLGPAMNA